MAVDDNVMANLRSGTALLKKTELDELPLRHANDWRVFLDPSFYTLRYVRSLPEETWNSHDKTVYLLGAFVFDLAKLGIYAHVGYQLSNLSNR